MRAPTFLLPDAKDQAAAHCPYGQPGDRLWVRETWAPRTLGNWPLMDPHMKPLYRASQDRAEWKHIWKPSIHMPRWACRILLEVTAVRVERLRYISEADAMAEGIERLTYGGITTYRNYALSDESASVSPMLESPIESYRTLWESINNNRPKLPTNTSSKRYARVLKWLETHPDTTGWDANPWVWVIEFKRMEPTA